MKTVQNEEIKSSTRTYSYLGHPEQEPWNGQPPEGSVCSIEDYDYHIKYQCAFQVSLWAMPATSIYKFRASAFDDIGAKDNDILTWSGTAGPNLEGLTVNSSTPYIAAYTDLQRGPVILEVPATGEDGSLYGQVVDAWQFTIADVGPSGVDKGKAAKYLFTPPGYDTTKIPDIDQYIHVPSPSYRIALAFRSIVVEGKTTEDAYNYAHRLRMYYLDDAGNPPEQKFIDPLEMRYASLIPYDEKQFEDIHAIFSVEPLRGKDKVMRGMLKVLGSERGKPFEPDETAIRAMRQAAIDVWFYLQNCFDTIPQEDMYWPDRHYLSLMMTDARRKFEYEYRDRIDIIPRAMQFMWCTYVPEKLSHSPATQYLCAMADNNGQLLKAGKTYKIDVPADVPVEQFWALTVYDRATFAFIYVPNKRTTLSTYDLEQMEINPDGSIPIIVGPKAPEGMEGNWIDTAGKRPMPMFRFYGPQEALNDQKTFKMPDFELVEL
ncbi:MAG: DUF1254 domain-containing protein [Cyanobacteriota bacterium]|nr:DUF1254 domain-containing protein [Cyanobacteriota bacterium]